MKIFRAVDLQGENHGNSPIQRFNRKKIFWNLVRDKRFSGFVNQLEIGSKLGKEIYQKDVLSRISRVFSFEYESIIFSMELSDF